MRALLLRRSKIVRVIPAGLVIFLCLSITPCFSGQNSTQSAELRSLLLSDMRLPHELPPSGIPENWNWGRSGRVGMGNSPGNFHAFIPWGQIYKVREKRVPAGTQVEIRRMLACMLPKRKGAQWMVLYKAEGVTGHAYDEDYKDNRSIDTHISQLSDGVTRMEFLDGYNLHFWPAAGRVDIDPSNIQGLYVSMQARWVEGTGGPVPPPLMLSAGADYWLDKTAKLDQFKTNNDAAIGRFRMLGPDWRTFTASTVGAEVLDRHPPDCLYPENGSH